MEARTDSTVANCECPHTVVVGAALSDNIGDVVSIDGDTIVLGAVGDDDAGADSGSVYVFRNVAGMWGFEDKLVALDAAFNDSFGRGVSIDGDTIVVGARLDDDGGSASGSAYVFNRVGVVWTQEAKLVAADAAANDTFDWAVSIAGDTIVVGAVADDDGGSDSGAAYVFR